MVAQDLTEPQSETTGQPGDAYRSRELSAPPPNLIAFVLPLIVFVFLAGLSPNFQGESTSPGAANHYLWLIIAEVGILGGLLACFWRIYLAHFPLEMDYLGWIVGGLGVCLWIGLCTLGLERPLLDMLGLPQRPGFDPYLYFPQTVPFLTFLFFRFTLLCLIVPLCEELFLRGWLVRYVENPNWETVSLSSIGWRGCLAVVVYAVLTHPAEAIAAAAWFSLVSWLMIKTGKFWNCVLAHAVTNLLLGIYVMWSEEWFYW